MGNSKIGSIVLIFIAIGFLSGCGLFNVREAEMPASPVDWNSFQTTPQKVLENLLYSYNYRENVYNYSSLFTDNFTFYFDAQDVNDFDTPSSWNKSSEIDMLMNTFQRINSSSEMQLILNTIPGQNDNIQANQAWLYRSYELSVPHSINTIPQLFQGKLRVVLTKDQNGFWKIKEWNDYRTLTNNTWGRMKNVFSL